MRNFNLFFCVCIRGARSDEGAPGCKEVGLRDGGVVDRGWV